MSWWIKRQKVIHKDLLEKGYLNIIIVQVNIHQVILVFIIFIILIVGCQSPPRTIDERIPDHNNLYELLHIGDNYAYKSITKKDYEAKDEC